MLEIFLVTLTGVIAAQASPGPNLVAVASAGLGQSRRKALLVASGIASGIVLWGLGVALGLGALLEAHPVLLTVIKIVGGGYLLRLGVTGLCSAWHGKAVSIRVDHERMTDGEAWRRGLLVVLTNPKAALMWAAVASFLFGSGLTVWQTAAFAPVGATSALTIYGGYALLFSTSPASAIYQRFWRLIEAAFGGLFSTFGATLILDGVRQVRT